MKLFKKAVLIIHGFSGGVFDQEYLFHQLEVIDKYDVYNFTLPGHDGEFKDKLTYESWVKKCDDEINFLIDNGYKEIYIVGHSMGGVLASIMASKYKEVTKLVLAAPAFRVFGFENGDIDPEDAIKKIPILAKEYSANVIFSKITRMPSNAVKEFFLLIREYQDIVSSITCSVLLLRGLDDNVVPEEAIIHVFQNVKSKDKKILHIKNTAHEMFREPTKEYSAKLVIDFFKNPKNVFKLEDVKNEE